MLFQNHVIVNVHYQEKSIQLQTHVNVQQIKYTLVRQTNVSVQQTYPFGMVKDVLDVQMEHNSMQPKNNVIIAHKDLLEIYQAMHAFQDFEIDIDILIQFILLLYK